MLRFLTLSLVALLLAIPGAATEDTNKVYDPVLYQALEYRSIGPHKGSRTTAVTGVPQEPHTFYMGVTGGGVWKTTDGGEIWFNITDGQFATGSVGAIDVSNSDPNIIYVGTGSACIRGNVSPGVGVYKSNDAGKSWRHVGLDEAGQIGRVIIHPTNPDIAYAAVLGHAFGPNNERGVYRTMNGGKSWERVLHVSDRTGANDIAMDITNARILYATMWTAERKPWTMFSGSKEGGIYKTTDGGDNWTKLTTGLPEGMIGRTGITVSPANPERIWALVEAKQGGVYRSDDAGETFTLVNTERELQNRPWYYMHIYADSTDENTVYIVSRYFHKSIDGGVTFGPINVPHGDHHDLWINPDNNQILIEGNDGGAAISVNGGMSWTSQLNQPTAEMYRVDVDNQFPYRVYGSQQDTYEVLSVPSRTGHFGMRLQLQHWDGVGGMEGGVAVIRPDNPNIVYSGSTSGQITRYDRATGQIRPIKAYPEMGGMPAKHLRYRFQRTAPIELSPHDPNVLYHASNYIHRTTDEGQTWEVISPDLTRNDAERLGTYGGPITREVTSEEIYCTIFAFAESPHRQGLLWVGTDDGLVQVSHDGGTNWKDVTPEDMPEWATVNILELSPHEAGRVFLAVQRYRMDDFKPYIFRTDDFGETWKLLTDGTNGIPANHFVRVVREDPNRKGLLYAGTEFGMYVSFDDGAHWQSLQLNFPVTPVTDLVVHEKDLVLSTQGRSFWILDDITPLHQITEKVARAQAYLFEPRPTYRVQSAEEEANDSYVGGSDYVTNPRDVYGGARIERHRQGTDAPDGAIIYTYFAKTPEEEVTLEILDQSGRTVRQFSNRDDPKDPSLLARPEAPWYKKESTFDQSGLNRLVWDLRYPATHSGKPLGPKVVPGTYQIRLSSGSWTQTQTFEIMKDPRIETSDADYQAQLELLSEIQDRISQIQTAVRTIHTVREQGERLVAHLEAVGKSEKFAEQTSSISEELSDIEQLLIPTEQDYDRDDLDYPPKLSEQFSFLYRYVGRTDARPTNAAYQRLTDLDPELSQLDKRLRDVLETELVTLNTELQQAGTGPIVIPHR